jgi:hypothetical protein
MVTITRNQNNSIVINSDDFVEVRKRAKHALELAKLNPKQVLSTTEVEYITHCSKILVDLVDEFRRAKADQIPLENEYFSVYTDQVIADRPYIVLSSMLTVAKRKQHNDAYRAKK